MLIHKHLTKKNTIECPCQNCNFLTDINKVKMIHFNYVSVIREFNNKILGDPSRLGSFLKETTFGWILGPWADHAHYLNVNNTLKYQII